MGDNEGLKLHVFQEIPDTGFLGNSPIHILAVALGGGGGSASDVPFRKGKIRDLTTTSSIEDRTREKNGGTRGRTPKNSN